MASFTDNIVAFNPYISEIPVDDYVRVGMQKQLEYNQGVKEVQGYIDSIAGIEALMPEQKEYIHQRINNLQQEVGKVVQADFSNQQLVNSVGALTSKMSSDPIIQATQASTQAYKQGLADMKLAREKGKSSVSNEWDFSDKFQKWYKSGDAASRFSGTFTPYTDVDGKIGKIIKDLDPNVHIEDIPFKRGADGKIVIGANGQPEIDWAMKHIESTTLTPERIEAAIRANLTPDDMNQLRIDGRYNYRGVDAQGMKDATDQSYQYKLDQVNDIIQGLVVSRAAINNNPTKAAQIDAQIAAYRDKAVDYQNSYKQEIDAINANLEGYKANMYSKNWLTRFGDSYAYAKESLTYKDNPYFMAAERRRENDIKFQEFMVDQRWKAEQLGIEKEKLKMGWYNAETARMSAEARALKGGKAKGALEGIALMDPVLGTIPQDELADVNEDNYFQQTKAISDDIDQQKMALLGNTGLVTIKRDGNGVNKRYEYNVAGKDPETVIKAADAAIAKLKEAYDKNPNNVDEGTRTYFRNLANADQVIQNRKFAIGDLQKQADRDGWSLKTMTDKISPLRITTKGGAKYEMSGEEQYNFSQKLNKILTHIQAPGASIPSFYDDNKAEQILTTPTERYMYNIIKKAQRGEHMSKEEEMIASKIRNVANIGTSAIDIQKGRNDYMNNAVKEISSVQQPVSFSLEDFEAPDRKRVQGVAANILGDIVKDKKSNPNPNFDKEIAESMLGKHAENTTYSLVSRGRGRYSLRLENNIIGKGTEMDITRTQAEALFGQGQFLDDFYNIRQSLDLTKGTGKWTTDVRGIGRDGAFNLNNSYLNKYSVKYHVEDPLKNGGLQIRAYIFDRTAGEIDPDTKKPKGAWLPDVVISPGQLMNEAQVTKMLSNMGDQYFDAILNKTGNTQ